MDGSKRYSQQVLSNYLFCHHLEKDSKHFIPNTNNALHHSCGDKERLSMNHTSSVRISTYGTGAKVPTRLVFLDGFVFKVAKHDLEPVRIIGSQHPGTKQRRYYLSYLH